jgi:hypothetical protein
VLAAARLFTVMVSEKINRFIHVTGGSGLPFVMIYADEPLPRSTRLSWTQHQYVIYSHGRWKKAMVIHLIFMIIWVFDLS